MKIAVMSCIHGNYEALNAVLSDMDDQNADKIYCLGDLIGYRPHPNVVVEMIRALDIPTCQGCWDEDIVEGLNACECSYPSVLAEKRGKLAHEWTNQAIHPEVREYLAQLPFSLRDDNLCFVHGSPHGEHGTDETIRYLSPQQLAVLYRVVASDCRMNALVHLLHRTGARISEILALNLSDLDLRTRQEITFTSSGQMDLLLIHDR